MGDLRRRLSAPQWGGRVLAAGAAVVSLALALVIALAPGPAQPRLTARGTPLPIPSTTAPAVPASTSPRAAAPATVPPAATTGLPAATILTSVGTDELVATSPTAAAVSSLGRAWAPIPVPPGTSGLVVDRADGDVLAAGGASVRTTTDAGSHWSATPAQPAATGPFLPLLISPWDARVLFVSHQGQVAVTTDAGGTWHDVAVPAGGTPVMAAGNAPGTFFVLAGSAAYQLTDNGARVNGRPPLPAGSAPTSLLVGQYLLVACCADRQLLILKGTRWTAAPITASGPLAVDGTDLWAAVPAPGGSAPEAVEESSDGGVTWQARPGLPPGLVVLSLALSGDGHTVYALTSGGDVYEAQNGIWYLLSGGLQLTSPPA